MKKMIETVLVILLTAAVASTAFGWGNDNDYDGYNSQYNYGSSNNAYEGSSGARYQYDMSNPSDRLNYGVDLDAQMRDQLSVDPSRGLDRGLGQFGGGIYD